ncbi:hypothetical protein L210DRAFT_3632870 [Boletus edulis BED1]|uniref:Uncharacterized protein n=1 Tax=Boletus edulis BED1 TaxID=1328754 RepID=A0AAD4GAI6_BOLED|nr:hypothetical protein L210DRAFT_3632870 [Boletus edulis BED1]
MSKTALDYLWADMDSFSPFVPLLPKQVQEIWDFGPNPAILPLIKCPPPAEWGLFDVYAYRIRPRDDYLDCALYQRLAFIRTGINPFPRLLSLQCYLLHPLTLGVKIFPSSLRCLSLYPEYTSVLDDRAELALRQAAQDAPFLEELCISAIYRLHLGAKLRPLGFKKLHTVQLIANVLRPDFQNFSCLLSTSPIRNLGISLCSSLDVSFRLGGAGGLPDTFPHLEMITIRDVKIHLDHFASISAYGRFFKLLAERRPPVHFIEVRMGRVCVGRRSEYVRGFLATLEPLVDAGLVGLKVEMPLYGAWKVEEDIKKRLRPEAWPSLACFEFMLTEASR